MGALIIKPTNGEEVMFMQHEQLAEACGDSNDSLYVEMGAQTVLRPTLQLIHGTMPLSRQAYAVEIVLENLDTGARSVGVVLDPDATAVLDKMDRFEFLDLLTPQVADQRISEADNEGFVLCRTHDRCQQLRSEAERLALVPTA